MTGTRKPRAKKTAETMPAISTTQLVEDVSYSDTAGGAAQAGGERVVYIEQAQAKSSSSFFETIFGVLMLIYIIGVLGFGALRADKVGMTHGIMEGLIWPLSLYLYVHEGKALDMFK